MTIERPGLSNVWKWLVIFLASLAGSAILHQIQDKHYSDVTLEAAAIFSGALAAWSIAMVFSFFVRGWGGVVLGIFIVAGFDSFIGHTLFDGKRPKQETLDSVTRRNREFVDSAKSQLEHQDSVEVSPETGRKFMSGLSSDADKLPPADAEGVKVLVGISSELAAGGKNCRDTLKYIQTLDFQAPALLHSLADIDERLRALTTFTQQCDDLLAAYESADITCKTRLYKLKLPKSKVKQLTDGFMSGLHLDAVRAGITLNKEFAAALKHRFYLLRTQFGRWHIRDGVIRFEDRTALTSWNDDSRRLIRIAEDSMAVQEKSWSQHQAELP